MPSITHTQTHTKINTYINTHKYAQIHKHKHRRVYINMQKYEHTHTNTHAFKRGKLNGPWKAHSLFIWLWTNPLGFEQRIITVSPN